MRQSDRRPGQQCRVTGDEPALLEMAQPAPAGRWRQPNALGELLIGNPGIPLQLIENQPVQTIQRFCHDIVSK